MMKRIWALVIAGILICGTCQAVSITLEGQAAIEYLEDHGIDINIVDNWEDVISAESNELSPENKCIIQPQFYACARYRDKDQRFAQDLSSIGQGNDFSAQNIKRQLEIGKRSYGLYLRFTPSWMDDGYHIGRIDFVITDPNNNIALELGMDTDLTCRKDTYVSWSFIELMDMFRNQVDTMNDVVQGKYQLDVYFNSQWAGKVNFKVKK